MRRLMDELENAAFKLQDMGKEALENASGQFEKNRPSLRESLDSAWNALEAGAEKAVESAKNACERAVDSLRSACEDLAQDSPESVSQKESDHDLDLDVEETLSKIRSAKSEPNIISDYISRKYGRDDN